MSKKDNARSVKSSTGPAGPPAAPEPSRGTESGEWAWMVDEDPAFCLEEAGRAPEKRGG
jgi:hypothetical protein